MQIEPTAPHNSETDLQRATIKSGGRREHYKRWRRILETVSSFFLGQGALQAVNILLGIFLIRALSVEAYAQYGLAFGFQSTAASLMDLGFASTIIPLVGNRIDDRELVGRYIHAAIRLRTRAFFFLAPFAVAAFVAIAHSHHWSMELQILLIIPVLVALYSSGNVSCHSTPFFLYRRLTQFYSPQTLTGLVRFGIYVVLQFSGWLNAWTAAAFSALNVTFISGVLARKSREWVGRSNADTHSAEREIVHYVMPAMPALIFGALQPQISLFLISIFGQTTSIAQVAALGRIAALFTVLQTFSVVIVEPYIARVSQNRLMGIYLKLIFLACACCIPVVILAFVWPEPILWALGSKYAGIRDVIGWLIFSSCTTYIAVLAWVMNRARKWVFWSGTILEIALILAVQTAFIIFIGVRTTREAVLFSLASSLCLVIAHAYNAVYGFLKGPRSIPPAEEAASPLAF